VGSELGGRPPTIVEEQEIIKQLPSSPPSRSLGIPTANNSSDSRPGTASGGGGGGGVGDENNNNITSNIMDKEISGEYRKVGTVLARLMEEGFSVKTEGGNEHGMSGDYLVQGEGGDQWSIEAKTFLELYERWD
jgi:hypothetical protein